MRKHVFKLLVWELTNKHGLALTKHIGVEESVVLFLYMIGHGYILKKLTIKKDKDNN